METKLKLYEKIKKTREDLGLSLKDVFERGVEIFGKRKAISYRTLQRIEDGSMAKFSSALKICCALGVPLNKLIENTEFEQRMVIRKKERLDEYTFNDKAFASVISSPNRSFLSLELILEPLGKTTLEQSPSDKIYEKWVYIVSGELVCNLENERFTLKSGDSISFDSSLPHYFENPTNKKCMAIVVQNPKSF